MALFRGTRRLTGSDDQEMRTNTKLQHSVHDAPPERYLIDPRLKRLFRYHFGGDGHVVIPQGRVVAPSADDGGRFTRGTIKDFDSGKYVPVLTLANGGKDVEEVGKDGSTHTRAANIPIGVAYANLYEEIMDDFNRMQPTVENEIYIEIPYIPNKVDAEAVHYGALYDVDMQNGIKSGDFVMADENGRFIKADFEGVRKKITDASDLEEVKEALAEESLMQEQVIGQVWAVETNLPPQGWLQWVGWSDEQRKEDDRPSGFSAVDLMEGDYPGYPYEKSYRNFDPKSNKYYPQGIPGLTDGSNIEVPFENLVIGYINPGQTGRHDFRIKHSPIVEGSMTVKIGGEEVEPQNVSYETGLVTLNIESNDHAEPQAVEVTFKATGQIPGVPTNWDFKGSVGAVRILLQK